MTLVKGDWKANSHHVYNVATQTSISLPDLVSIINKSLANKIDNYSHLEPIHDLERPGDIRHSMASISRIKQVLNWQPNIGFQEGIDALVSERLSML